MCPDLNKVFPMQVMATPCFDRKLISALFRMKCEEFMQNTSATNQPKERRLLQAGLIALEKGDFPVLEGLLAGPATNPSDEQDAHLLKGLLAIGERKFKAAIEHLSAVLRSDPNHLVAWFNLGQVLLNMEDYTRAMRCFVEVLRRDSGNIEALYLRGLCHRALGDHANAGRDATDVVHRQPEHVGALKELGNSLLIAGKFSLARNVFQSVNALAPSEPFVPCMIQFLSHQMCDWAPLVFAAQKDEVMVVGSTSLDVLKQRCERNEPALEPFASLVLFDDPELHEKAASLWMKKLHPKMPQEVFARLEEQKRSRPLRTPQQALKVAYISCDFYEHATAYLMAGLIEAHDRQAVEVYVLSYGQVRTDAMRQRLEKAADHFVDINNMPDWQVARWCRENDIDIAVDLKGLTRDSRPGIFAHRAAQVQVSWLGYPGSLAADFYDYMIADEFVMSEQQKAHTQEALVLMPNGYQVNDSQRPKPQPATRKEHGLPDEAVVLCCFNNHFKITESVFNCWMDVLNASSNTVLWLMAGSSEAENNLIKQAVSKGIAKDRLIFAPVLPLPQHISRLALADISLDTSPYNAHTTASDALWAGVPHLGLQGQGFAARVSSSLLHAIGMPELVTDSLERYQALLQQLTCKPKKLKALRAKLGAQKHENVLFNSAQFAKHLESAYRQMYAVWAEKLPKRDLEIR